jgi:hypothetical protein
MAINGETLVKKLLPAGTSVLLMATSASAQSTSPTAGFFGGGGGYYPVPPAVRAKMLRDLERGKAIHECRAYGNCGQQRR